MRLAMVTQWLRAAGADPARRVACLRYAAGITVVQVGWVARLAVPGGVAPLAATLVLVAAELAVPVYAERAAPTTWNRSHIAERYGLFTLIVLGESVLSATVAVQSALDAEASLGDLATIALGGLLMVSSMWWFYFAKDVLPPVAAAAVLATAVLATALTPEPVLLTGLVMAALVVAAWGVPMGARDG